ncbi:PTS sugar transporter subunit IIA [Providencia vermicola]|uniref:PTS sugar transporter subunit IIA n=2 Tax=Providencia TaxID=586 RepID=A0AAI9MWF1_PROST|nr:MULTISPECIES: PTS sugar transporter subunit IIA [Providencia]ELR5046206.1 PTS sugar transporter subunit IIA [Providencia rettgeri]ELR5035921.1 PTS sugar transporter subunit IIA [Providencia stuartii]ELR5121325.1 PTS sugar transporter subunit IIA [Providencia stuartii]ELR5142126.1 PTS sugar transporter subunit IIA [Providencia stuartii]ELR5291533.1 PTS sugar transporter subunit IIA [Providencia stuartii]
MIDDAKWIQINQVATDWKEALSIACRPLIRYGAAEPNYLQGIIKNTQSWGPYYLIAPGIAMPHARPEQGAIYNQMTLTTLKQPVVFGHEDCDPVWLLMTVCAIQSNDHIRLIQHIAEIVDNPLLLDEIRFAKTNSDILKVLNPY